MENAGIGSAIGGFLYADDLPRTVGFVGAIFVALALALVFATRPRIAVAA